MARLMLNLIKQLPLPTIENDLAMESCRASCGARHNFAREDLTQSPTVLHCGLKVDSARFSPNTPIDDVGSGYLQDSNFFLSK